MLIIYIASICTGYAIGPQNSPSNMFIIKKGSRQMPVQDLDGRETAAILYSHALLLESSFSLHEGFYRCEKSPTSSDPVKKMISCEPHFPAQTLPVDISFSWTHGLPACCCIPCPLSPRLWTCVSSPNKCMVKVLNISCHPSPTCGLDLLPAVFTSLTPEQVRKADGLWVSLVSLGPAFLTAAIFYMALFHHRRQKSRDSEQRLVERLEVDRMKAEGGAEEGDSKRFGGWSGKSREEALE